MPSSSRYDGDMEVVFSHSYMIKKKEKRLEEFFVIE